MLHKELFNRVQVTDILGYVSYHSVERLEKMGLITPVAKPSKYSLSQVLFLLTCQHIKTHLKLTHKELSSNKFNISILPEKYKSSYLKIERRSHAFSFAVVEDSGYIQNVQNLASLLQDQINRIKPGIFTEIGESSILILPFLGYDNRTEIVLLPKILEILEDRCSELNIDLKEKIVA